MRWPPRPRRSAASQASHVFLGALVTLIALAPATAPARPQSGPDALLNRLQATGLVNDFAGLLNAEDRAAIEARLSEIEKKTGAQIAVVTLRSLEGGEIDDFAARLFERWKIGQAGRDNGVLILVAVEDRKARIEVGYGLEPILPDGLAGRLLRQKILSAFRKRQFSQGLRDGALAVAEVVERNEPASADDRAGRHSLPQQIILGVFMAPFVLIGGFILGLALGMPWKPELLSNKFLTGLAGLAFGVGGSAICYKETQIAIAATVSALGLAMIGPGIAAGRQVTNLAASSYGGRGRRWRSTWVPSGGAGHWGSYSGGFGGGGGSSWGGFGGGSSGGGGASGGW